MERNVAFLKDIQDAYASLANLTMVIIDPEGKRLTDASFRDDFSKKIFARKGARKFFIDAVGPLGTIKTPILLDSISGAKCILAPIYVNHKLVYYLFAGYILEQASRSFVTRYIETHKDEPEELLPALNLIPECTEEEKREKLELVTKCSNIISDYLNLQDEKTRNTKKLSVVQQSLELIRKDGMIADSLMRDILSTNFQYDFIGLALESKGGTGDYVVDFIEGRGTEPLKGHRFVLGEGFLGHTIAIEQFQLWKNIGTDPRKHLFTKKDMKIKSLFCIPVYGDHQVKGVYFGGSYEMELTEKETREHANLKSAILSILMTTKNLRTDLQNHLMELSTFNEIFRVITSVEDIKRVLYILVDISINVIRGPFSCIVSMPADRHSKVEIVSRGLTPEEINNYGSDVARRMSRLNPDQLDISHPDTHKTSWGEKVLEFPLVFHGRLYGVLCVGCPPKSEPDHYESFLSSLAVAGSISLHLHQRNRNSVSSGDLSGMMERILASIGPEKYQHSLRVKEILVEFTGRYYKERTELLAQASSLIEYDETILTEVVKDLELTEVLKEFHHIIKHGESIGVNGEILAMIDYFVQQNEMVEALNDFPAASPILKDQFIEYVNHQHVIESKISFSIDSMNISTETKRTTGKDLKELTQLSARETDVLRLVLKGYSNFEIASELYISDHTVKNHMTKILQKLGVSDRSQAIAKVYKLGYSPTED
jgi:DNA-binding CsgD family transcriptional regulator/ligand-binding sensor protein